MKKEFPNYWTDLIGEIHCGANYMSKKIETYTELKGFDKKTNELIYGKREVYKNKTYIPLSKRNKNCTKKLGLNCIECPFALIFEAEPGLIKHIKKYYNSQKR